MPSSIYIDDVFIYGDSLEEVLHYTTLALTRLAEAGFMINLRKSHIGVTKGTVLGHLWASGGYFSPVPGKLEAILEYSEQQLAKMNRPTLYGILNWFKPYVPDFAIRTEPIRQLLAKPHLLWGPQHTQSVKDTISHILSGIPRLNFNPVNTLRLEFNTGPIGMSGVLLQKDPSTKQFLPIASHSRVWLPKERFDSGLGLELVCVHETLSKL